MKKSFQLNYHNGTIWCEHLDGMGEYEEAVINKLWEDKSSFARPSVSSYMIVNLDETIITENIVNSFVSAITACSKVFRKIAFVGVDKKWHKCFVELQESKGSVINFINDYEKAKEWLFL